MNHKTMAFFKPTTSADILSKNFQAPRESLNHDFLKLFLPGEKPWHGSKSKCDKSNVPHAICITLMAGAIITSSFLTSSGIIVLCEKYGNGIKYYQRCTFRIGFCNPCFPVSLFCWLQSCLIAMQRDMKLESTFAFALFFTST